MNISAEDIVGAMRRTQLKVMESVDYLNELDAKMGDGEHGSNMRKSFMMVKDKIDRWNSDDRGALLQTIGKTLLSSGGGTATTLFGIFFVYAGVHSAKFKDDWNADSLGEIAGVAFENLQRRSTAQLGDKTIVDALAPAITTFRSMACAGQPLSACLEAAAKASEKGAADTVTMIAKKGRGLYMGERGLGTPDPGAVSVSLIVRSWASYCEEIQKPCNSEHSVGR